MDLIASCALIEETALKFLHNNGITHGDLHPGNIMYFQGGENGQEGKWKLIDFGKAKFGYAEKAELDKQAEDDRADLKKCFNDKHEKILKTLAKKNGIDGLKAKKNGIDGLKAKKNFSQKK